jgi:hypothetical protein
MKIFKSIFLSCLFSFSIVLVNAQAVAHLKHHHPLPLMLCMVKAGTTTDSMVVKMYGEGMLNPKEGNAGARYFRDETKKIILRTVAGADNVIEEVALSSYKLPFGAVKDKLESIPVSKKLNAQSIMMGNIHTGDKKEKIMLQFGDPNKTESMNEVRVMTYEDTQDEWKEVKNYRAAFEFKDDRLERITISNKQ